MKRYITKKYYRYIVVITLIFTLAFVFAGKLTVEERGKEIFIGEKYETVMIEKNKGSVDITGGERTVSIGEDLLFGLKKLSEIKKYTPLHTFFYALQNIEKS